MEGTIELEARAVDMVRIPRVGKGRFWLARRVQLHLCLDGVNKMCECSVLIIDVPGRGLGEIVLGTPFPGERICYSLRLDNDFPPTDLSSSFCPSYFVWEGFPRYCQCCRHSFPGLVRVVVGDSQEHCFCSKDCYVIHHAHQLAQSVVYGNHFQLSSNNIPGLFTRVLHNGHADPTDAPASKSSTAWHRRSPINLDTSVMRKRAKGNVKNDTQVTTLFGKTALMHVGTVTVAFMAASWWCHT